MVSAAGRGTGTRPETMETDDMARIIATMNPEQRRATAEALKIARSADKGRNALRSLIVHADSAYVTDSYRAVRLDWIGDESEDTPLLFDADALYSALKGAGKDWARLDITDDGHLQVMRFEPPYGLTDTAGYVSIATPGPGIDVSYVAQVDAHPPKIAEVVADAFAASESDQYVPELAPLNGDLLASLVKCHPGAFEKGANRNALTIKPRGPRTPAVVCNGHPFAIIMPMKVG